MESSQKEVTKEIRNAIKKKLVEINAFVDDELPEYIMILVANKRSRAQISKDLSLFLGSETTKFTEWLEKSLKSLKIAPKGFESPAVPTEETKHMNEISVNTNEDADVLNYDPNEEGDELNCEYVSKVVSSKNYSKSDVSSKSVNKSYFPSQSSSKKERSVDKQPKIQKLKEPAENARVFPTSAVKSVHQSVLCSADKCVLKKPDVVKGVSSVVCFNKKKRSLSSALQTNKLLLKAVDDATKSVLKGKNINDYYKPTPIKVVASDCYKNVKKPTLKVSPEIISDSLSPKQPEFVFDNHSLYQNSSDSEEISEDFSFERLQHEPSRTICLKGQSSPEFNQMEDIKINVNQYPVAESSKEPHFFVTLEGVKFGSLKRKYFEDNSVEVESVEMEDEEEKMSVEENETPEKKIKLNERCKYWPACKNSDHCMYHHPTIPCKCFPDCKFGDKCLYIHPNCKFDALCSRKSCPFTHASKRKLSLVQLKTMPLKVKNMKTVCKFYPKCASRNCPFVHPKPCRYGTECRSPKCIFTHIYIPSRNKLKWHASTT